MGIKMIQVDAFTDEAFGGNPAAVCFLTETRDDGWMQRVAREMNLSETAFLLRGQDGFSLRWFTPAVEVDLCGHATLASAHALWEEGVVPSAEPLRFHTRSGLLGAKKREGIIELDFPATPETPCAPPPGLSRALGAEPTYIGHSAFDYLVLLRDAEAVRRLSPDMGLAQESLRPRDHRHRAVGRPQVRLRFPLLRPGRRYRRGSRHGFRPLLPRPLLAGQAGESLHGGLSGLRPRRSRPSRG